MNNLYKRDSSYNFKLELYILFMDLQRRIELNLIIDVIISKKHEMIDLDHYYEPIMGPKIFKF